MGRLVAGILHEMNTPLGALSSATQTLSRALARLEPAGESRATLDALERLTGVQAASGERIREVVTGLEQFVALDHTALQVTDVRGGLETAVAFIRPCLPRGVELTLELPASPLWVKCFPAKLNHVFLNLLKNAAAAFEEPVASERAGRRPREIRVKARVASGQLRIEVRDTGRGIPAERLERIFELDFSRQGPRVKLCLGLPASRGVVDAIGGKIALESELGRGSLAIIELPLGETPPASAVAAASIEARLDAVRPSVPAAAVVRARAAHST